MISAEQPLLHLRSELKKNMLIWIFANTLIVHLNNIWKGTFIAELFLLLLLSCFVLSGSEALFCYVS